MVHHIVVWRLKKKFSDKERLEALTTLKAKVESLKNIPGIGEFTVTAKIHPKTTMGGDFLLHSTHADQAGLDAYYSHPAHTAFVEFAKTVIESRDLIDYEE